MSDKDEKEKPMTNDEIRGAILTRIFSAAAQPTEADKAKAMDMTIRAIAHDNYNPQQLRAPETATPVGAPVVKTFGEGRGFIEDKPYGPVVTPGSMEDRVMSALIDQALPPGGEKKDRK